VEYEHDDPRLAEFIRKYPLSSQQIADIEAAKIRLEAEVARMKVADLAKAQQRDREIDPEYVEPEYRIGQPVMSRIGDRLAGFLDRLKEKRDRDREAFTGDCWHCHDDGPCAFCRRGSTEIERIKREAHESKVDRWAMRAALPAHSIGWRLDTFPVDIAAHAAVCAFVEAFDGHRWLLLHGQYGTGKTGLVVSAMRELAPRMIERNQTARFVAITDLYDSFRAAYDGAPMPDYRSPDLLVIDDLGAARQTEWATEQLFGIINGRLSDRKATWVTTNLAPEALAGVITPRIYWRLHEQCHMIDVAGPNLRVL
jgi:DNA replication protein DnaC